jgi:hypothetical protein
MPRIRSGSFRRLYRYSKLIKMLFAQALEDGNTIVLRALWKNTTSNASFPGEKSDIYRVWGKTEGETPDLDDLLRSAVENGDLETTKFLFIDGKKDDFQCLENLDVLTRAAVQNRSDIFCCLLQQDWFSWDCSNDEAGAFIAKVVRQY